MTNLDPVVVGKNHGARATEVFRIAGDGLEYAEAATRFQLQVEDGQIGSPKVQELDGRALVGGVSDHLNPIEFAEQNTHRPQHERGIFDYRHFQQNMWARSIHEHLLLDQHAVAQGIGGELGVARDAHFLEQAGAVGTYRLDAEV